MYDHLADTIISGVRLAIFIGVLVGIAIGAGLTFGIIALIG